MIRSLRHWASGTTPKILVRMFNPYLGDTVERVGRDCARKLAWDDRLIGTIRAGLRHGIHMKRFGFGAAAAACVVDPATLNSSERLRAVLEPLWQQATPAVEEKRKVLHLVQESCDRLRQWRQQQFPHLENFIQEQR